jgi:hypothetical protein
MSELRSSGELKVRSDGTTCLRASVHLDGGMWIQCCTYPDRAPVLAIDSGPVEVSVGALDFAHVTAEDVAQARRLAATVAEFVAELERRADLDCQAPDESADSARRAA